MKSTKEIVEFNEIFQKLCVIYNKAFSDTLCEFYYNSLDNYDITTIKEASEKIIKTKKYFPKIAEFYELIIEIEQQKRSVGFDHAPDSTECAECNSTGLLFAANKTKQTTYSYVFRCAACDNWRDHVGDFVPRVSRATLKDQGYHITIGG